ncbi:hypothetical protein [Brevibacillus laterosporus]|uniref:hypothetical protein n=1 Tax=Brevibacillus laterosporus TaxID=1465 RepID=UPI0018CFC94D|nr:hypothetical protein [Brevibacillus laterosporus]
MSQLQKESNGRQKRAVFLIPLAWGDAEIAAYVVGGVAADAIQKKLKKKNDDYSVDLDKFTDKVKGRKGTYKDQKTGWTIEKTRGTGGDKNGHKGDVWKLNDRKGERIASLTKEGKIVGQ